MLEETQRQHRFIDPENAELKQARARLVLLATVQAVSMLILLVISLSITGIRREMRHLANISLFGADTALPLEELSRRKVGEFAQYIVLLLGNMDRESADQVVSEVRGRVLREYKLYFSEGMAEDVEYVKGGDMTISTRAPTARYIKEIHTLGKAPEWYVIVRAYQSFHTGDIPKAERWIDVELRIGRQPLANTFRPGVKEIVWPRIYSEDGEIVDVLKDKG